MPTRFRSAAVTIATAALLGVALSGCGVMPSPSPTTTTLDGRGGVDGTGGGDEGDGGGGDPFPPEFPTSLAGWKARYTNLPWLADDLDNDDYFITGSMDGHDVMGFFCGNDGNPDGYAFGTDGTYVTVSFQSDVDLDATVLRSDPYITFQGTGTFALPREQQGTSAVTPSFDVALQVDSTPGKETSSPTTAEAGFEFLGVPIPDAATCDQESSELQGWLMSEFGY